MNAELLERQITPPVPSLASRSSLKVLLIEDNPGDARWIQLMLAEGGGESFELEQVDRLAGGLDRLAAGGIGMVLLDLSLPDSQGLGTFARLHAQAPAVPIIVMSGLDDETVAVQAVHGGAQDYLVKGHVDSHLLVRAIRYAIERKRTADQLARYAEELREKNAQMEADFNMAREIQQVLLPQQYPVFPPGASPQESRLRFCHRYRPAAAVGGDFFNIFALTGSSAGVFICDVMGHGMRAALVTAILRGLVEELKPAAAEPGRFLTELNRSLHAILRRTEEPLLATAVYLIIDAAEQELRFASAGHPSPFLVRRSQAVAEPLTSCDPRHGPALGLFERSDFPTCHCPLSVEDMVILFTDGLYEVDGPGQAEYGQERLLAAVRRKASLPAPQLFDEILNEVQQFSQGKEFGDDVCLVGVELASSDPARPAKGGRL